MQTEMAAKADRPKHRDLLDSEVSVIIPSYNSASILPRAIETDLAQTRPVLEIIVVDDGSRDKTDVVCARFSPTVRYIYQDNRGAPAARNAGIAAARGDWLSFLDADDTWASSKLELQLAALRQNPEADFAVAAALAWSPSDETYHLYRYGGALDPNVMRAGLLIRNILSGICSSLLVSSEAIRAVEGFAECRGCEDRRLAIDLLERHRAVIVDLPLIRQHRGPAQFSDPEIMRTEMLRLIRDYDDLFARLDPTGMLKRRALARVHERTGMHYLANGSLTIAARELTRAVVLWPLMANPWRVVTNAILDRLQKRSFDRPQPASVALA